MPVLLSHHTHLHNFDIVLYCILLPIVYSRIWPQCLVANRLNPYRRLGDDILTGEEVGWECRGVYDAVILDKKIARLRLRTSMTICLYRSVLMCEWRRRGVFEGSETLERLTCIGYRALCYERR